MADSSIVRYGYHCKVVSKSPSNDRENR
jgi:hypothetical protein